jgi:hypothetical protein
VRDAAERASSRTVLLASVVTVLVSVAAGYFLWWTLSAPEATGPSAARREETALDAVVLRAVEYPPGVTADERDRVERLAEALFAGADDPDGRERASLAEEGLVSEGTAAVPRLLTELHRLHERDRFEGGESRARAATIDRILARIRRSLPTSPPLAARALAGGDPPATVARRARAWLSWWDRRSEAP